MLITLSCHVFSTKLNSIPKLHIHQLLCTLNLLPLFIKKKKVQTLTIPLLVQHKYCSFSIAAAGKLWVKKHPQRMKKNE